MVAAYVWPDGITEERQEVVAAIVWVLHDQGPIRSEEGRATALLLERLHDAGIDISAGWLNKNLVDLEKRGVFGHFIDRTVRGKRTMAIACSRDPRHQPFPPSPFVDEEPEEAGDEVVEDAVITDLEDLPGVALALIDNEPSLADKILYIVSLLNEILTDQLTAPERNFEARLDARLTAVNGILEENARLKEENEGLREDKRKLASALEQANAMMRERAAQNGAREPVSA